MNLKKTDYAINWKFYPEQHNSNVTWNELEKLSVMQLETHLLINDLTANACRLLV